MRPEDVVVTNLGDGGAFSPEGQMFPELIEDEYLRTKIVFEMQKRESILNALRDIPGVRVEVNAELDDTVQSTTRTRKPDPKPVMSHEVETKDESKQYAGAGGGQPGVVAQGPTRQGATTPADQIKNETTSSSTETTNMVGIDETNTLKKGYTLREVWAIVTIPSSYVENIWKQRNPTATNPPTSQEMQLVQDDVRIKVENVVEPLLLLREIKLENTYKHVRVVILDSLPVPSIEPPSTTSQALAWTGRYWSTLAMLGVAMFSLLVLRSVVKGAGSGQGAGDALATPALTLQAGEGAPAADEEAEAKEEPLPRIRLKKSKSLKDDLLQIVHEDPDAAADILRSWISKAS
jgi:flagellar M-ring protein FliF